MGHTREVKEVAPTFYFSFQILKEKNKAAEMEPSFESIMYLAIKLNWQEIDIPATLPSLKKLSFPWWHTYREKHQKLKKNKKYKIFNQKQSTKQTDDYTQQFLVVTKRSEVDFSQNYLPKITSKNNYQNKTQTNSYYNKDTQQFFVVLRKNYAAPEMAQKKGPRNPK